MSQQPGTAHVVAYLRALYDINTVESIEEPGFSDRLCRMVFDRFPGIDIEQIRKALRAFMHELDAEAEAEEQADEALVAAMAICRAHGVPDDMPISEGLRMAASAGDAAASALLNQFDGPNARVERALWNAAVEAHPAWSQDEHGFILDEDKGGPQSLNALVDWYQLTFPREAAAIEQRVRSEVA